MCDAGCGTGRFATQLEAAGRGDDVIVAVSNAMRTRLRNTDIIARVGGDEFAVLLPTGGADVARHVADMLVNVLRDDIALVAAKELGLTASIGLALFDATGLSADDMLIKADLAMYDAKALGRDQWAENTQSAPTDPITTTRRRAPSRLTAGPAMITPTSNIARSALSRP